MNSSLCRAPICAVKSAPTCELLVVGYRASVGRYRSTRCRDAVAAAVAIRTAVMFETGARRERVEALADALLAAWRERRGPDPAVVAACLTASLV